ncbi:MAG: hypothetical protein AB9856_05460 [Cellulosilyticaceae bacterium]
MMHIDAYTILYHTKENLTSEGIKTFFYRRNNIDEQELKEHLEEYSHIIRELSKECLENGIKVVGHELPPSVSKRMRKYYKQNSETLIDAFSVKLKDEILNKL